MQRLIILWALWLSACASAPAQIAHTKSDASFILTLSPASLHQTLQLSQQLVITYKGQSHQLDGLLEATPSQLQIALIKFGRRVLTLHYDGVNLDVKKDALVPKEVQPERILSDLQLVFWPYDSIVEKLPPDYALIDHNNTRTLSYRDEVMMHIQYSATEPHWQNIELTNLKFNYSMTITSQNAS